MTRREQRIRIMNAIYQYLLTNKSVDELLKEVVDVNDKESIPFIVENTVGVINNIDELINDITPYLIDYKFTRLGYIEQAILLMSAYQMKEGTIDRPIIINEAVEIAKKYCDDDAPKFINGVLDQL